MRVANHILPWRPWWPGVAINTTFYGMILWGLPFAFSRARRLIRYNAGRCPTCGYDWREGEVRGGHIPPGCCDAWHGDTPPRKAATVPDYHRDTYCPLFHQDQPDAEECYEHHRNEERHATGTARGKVEDERGSQSPDAVSHNPFCSTQKQWKGPKRECDCEATPQGSKQPRTAT